MNNEVFYKSINELNKLYLEKKLSVVEATDLFNKRISNLNKKYNAYLDIYNLESKLDASNADKKIKNGVSN